MIFVFGGGEICVALVVLVAILSCSFETMLRILNVIWLLFAASNVIMTVGVGYFKNGNALNKTLSLLTVDAVRITLFFTTLKAVGGQIQSQSGLGYIYSLCVFVVYFLIFSAAFGLGEIVTFAQMDKSSDVPFWTSIFSAGAVAVLAWLGYIL